MSRPAYLPDNFVLALLGMVLLASLLPVTGTPAAVLKGITNIEREMSIQTPLGRQLENMIERLN